MSDAKYRLPTGGSLLNRTRPLGFTFDRREYQGWPGDTLASALLAHGVRLVGRSFKYHRPRGILSAGVEEPNALVHIGSGARLEPNTRATVQELYQGLQASSQHCWPSLRFDIGALNNLLSPLFPAGFYYKTFMWPASFWQHYEAIIRRAAGLGTASRERDPDRYDSRNSHCEVLVIGAGPAGLSAALAAAETGQRVLLLDENPYLGGWLRKNAETVDSQAAPAWIDAIEAELRSRENVIILPRTTAFGYYDHNLIAAVERVQDHSADFNPWLPRQRLWRIRARRVILASGSIEQPLVFADNDRPGVMLAGAVRAYIHNYAVLPGRRALLLANHDDAYRTAVALLEAGATVAAIVDLRARPGGHWLEQAKARGIPVLAGHGIAAVNGRHAISSAEVAPLATSVGTSSGTGSGRRIECDLIAMSGGWSPVVHLHSQSGGKLDYRADLGVFVPGAAKQASQAIGAAAGVFELDNCLAQGRAAGAGKALPVVSVGKASTPEQAVLKVPGQYGKPFVDFQNDVTLDDIALAEREGYRSVEHLKRYTTLGMGTDQGKTSNINALTVLAAQRGDPVPTVGTTTFRPPYTPVTLGALAGRTVGQHFKPLRRTALDEWHSQHGAVWIDAGLWRRPHYYPRPGENVDSAAERETIATRSRVGLCDVSTLGKIDIQGPDAAEFLNRVYVNGFAKLPIGRARYGVMLREDGLVDDDGTTSRLGEQHYLMTTTTANAARVLSKLEYYLQVIWPELRVLVTSVTEQWAGMSIAGPKAREVLAPLLELDLSNAGFPFMAAAECTFQGVPARLFRISFSGELAYELNVPADYGPAVWEAIIQAGEPHELVVYGMEALGTMRVEKGHVAGAELNGQTTLDDLGLAKMAGKKKAFIGKALLDRDALNEPARQQLVGLQPLDGKSWIKAGSQLVADKTLKPPVEMLGHVTSIAYSPELQTPIALALLAGGLTHEGETLYAAFPLKNELVPVRVVAPHFIDPKGERLHV
ncbi:MAG: sarcosine oxidase subunit alpha family protein [Candidatus Competibacteraceae bacterium]|nr:sarcosine oxidase subunit alpha family protein [Candidatus Competibacteraceae bacterium]